MRKINLLLLFVFTSMISFCQFTDEQFEDFLNTASLTELVQQNTMFATNLEFYRAQLSAEKLVEKEPDNANFNYRLGFALINSTVDYTKSKPHFIKAATKISKNYDMFSPRESGAPVDAYYHLARVYHLSNEIDKALEYYQTFLDNAPRKSEHIEKAKLKMIQCEVAKKLLPVDKGFEIVNVGSKINTPDPDYAPVVSLDGSALYFTSRRLRADSSNIDIKEPGTNMHLEDIYVSYKGEDEEWMESKIMNFSLPEQNEATVYVSPDERVIYVYQDKGGIGNIYYSNFEGSRFREIEEVRTKGVNTKYWEPHLTVTPDGRRKYFTSDRPGGYGGRDIYVIEKDENDNWSEPKNLGPTINTKYDEDAPFMSVDNKTFYFSSNGERSMGGFDVFSSKLDDEGNWSEPENLGVPLNTTGDDIYYTTTIDGYTGYLSSFRVGGKGEKDIYEIKNTHLGIDKVAALVGEIETVEDLPIPEDVAYTLVCTDCEDSYPLELFPRMSDGTFFAPLEACKTYKVTFHHNKGKDVLYTEVFETDCVTGFHQVYRHILLDTENMTFIEPKQQIISFEPLSMKHLFAYNKNALNPEKGALNEFLTAVKKQVDDGRTEINLKINSSASKVRTSSFSNNQVLAQTRANQLKELLENYYKGKDMPSINITINEVKVDGPEYVGDYKDIDKYAPYQYVSINLEGINNVSDEVVQLSSKDAELSEGGALTGTTTKTSVDKDGDTFEQGTIIESDYTYQVVVGVFKRMNYATSFVEDLKAKGFSNAAIVGKRNGLNVVSVGAFNKVSDAIELQTRARKEVIPSAWILNTKKAD